MKTGNQIDKASLAIQANAVEKAAQEAVREALLAHKRLGHSIVICEGEKVLVIPPEEIEIDTEHGS